ncbi:putative ABC transport system permease protein [Roseivirga pacifica]|uniref:Putative ABC transport system permease protein n=1 Tax=Roseivirga pacifica TaxID=1267423 RepID=A0A1I0MX51_9BACT|nr:ABC transporter permease [Roseivirga pacifica]RKQ50752.1 putative ABC transport system permease protein [Roseivirga pacifica]SEV93035.1 putative ABC transport system permease protein [Roseivirga pacifica]
MLFSYIRTAFRSLVKNKTFSVLNILGLALGMACCMIIFQYVTYEKSYDKFHTDYQDIYRVQYNYYQNGNTIFECAAAVPAVGRDMKDNFPEVLEFARAFPISGLISQGDVSYREEKLQIADPSWLTLFDWGMVEGNPETALEGPNKAVISKRAATKYFGNENPMGKTIRWNSSWINEDFIVTGIIENVPSNSHIKFDILLSYQTLVDATDNEAEVAWGWYDFNTYVKLAKGTDPIAFNKKYDEHLHKIRGNMFAERNNRQEFPLQAMTDIHLKSKLLQESEPEENGDAQSVYFLGILAVFILIIAWVNYINLASSQSMERAKEVGVRKVMGAMKGQLVWQFIIESIIVNLVAAFISVGLVSLSLPYFNQLTNAPLSLALIFNSGNWLLVIGVFLAGAFLSSLYPAFVLSSFRPIVTLKGKMTTSHKGIFLRKSLVTFQFLASVFLISGTFIVYKQLQYLKQRDLGFEMAETLVLQGPGYVAVDSLYRGTMLNFKNQVLHHPNVEAFTTSSNVPGDEIFWTNGAKRAEAPNTDFKTIYNVEVDYDYFPSFEIDVVAGRNFDRSHATDVENVMLNEAATRFLGFENAEDAVGKRITHSGRDKLVVGVVDNYNQMSLKNDVAPILYWLNAASREFIAIKFDGIQAKQLLGELESDWDAFFPGNPMDYFYLDTFFNRQYEKDNQFGTVFSVFSVLAIVVSCLGLFGLSAFSTIQRTKEIGIRKVLGASISSILMLLSREYLILILVAIALGVPLTFFVMNGWLESFAYRTSIGWVVFGLSAIIVIVVALVTVSYQTLKSARRNPSNTLRYE